MSYNGMYEVMEDRMPLIEISNFLFSGFCTEENISAAIAFVPREGDVLISSYPFAMSSWVIQCIWKLLNMWCENPDFSHAQNCLSSLEVIGTDQLNNVVGPRLIRSNLPYWLTNRNPNAKYIYVTRNPKDTLVAYYLNNVISNNILIPFENFFRDFLRGRLPYGSYFEHVQSWYGNRQPNILFINYENMHVNPRRRVLDIARFLGPRYYEACLDDYVMDHLLQFCNQDYRAFTVEGRGGLFSCLPELFEKQARYFEPVYRYINQGGLLSINCASTCIGIRRKYQYITESQNEVINFKISEIFSEERYRNVGGINMLSMLYM